MSNTKKKVILLYKVVITDDFLRNFRIRILERYGKDHHQKGGAAFCRLRQCHLSPQKQTKQSSDTKEKSHFSVQNGKTDDVTIHYDLFLRTSPPPHTHTKEMRVIPRTKNAFL